MGDLTRKDFLALEAVSLDIIDVKRIYIDIAGDLVSGVLLSQIMYWHLPGKKDHRTKLRVESDGQLWLAKNRNDWWEECRISPTQYDRAIQVLVDMNIVVVKNSMFDGKRTPFIRLDWEVFLKKFSDLLPKEEKHDVTENRSSVNINTGMNEECTSLTETTSQTTSFLAEKKGTGLPLPGVPKTEAERRAFGLAAKRADRLAKKAAEATASAIVGNMGEAVRDKIRSYLSAYLDGISVNGGGKKADDAMVAQEMKHVSDIDSTQFSPQDFGAAAAYYKLQWTMQPSVKSVRAHMSEWDARGRPGGKPASQFTKTDLDSIWRTLEAHNGTHANSAKQH